MPLIKNVATVVATAVAEKVQDAVEAPKAKRTLGRTLKTQADPVVAEVVAIDAAIESIAKSAADSLQPLDMKPEQKRIQRSGIWQAVIQSNALVQYAATHEAYLELVDKVADRGLQYVNRH